VALILNAAVETGMIRGERGTVAVPADYRHPGRAGAEPGARQCAPRTQAGVTALPYPLGGGEECPEDPSSARCLN
jgi:hypothetical protein